MNKQMGCEVCSQIGEAQALDKTIRENAEALGYGC